MLQTLRKLGRDAIPALVAASVAHARSVLAASAVLGVLLVFYVFTHLSVDTSIANMLDDSLRFRQLEQQLDRTFPQFAKPFVAVIEAASADQASDAAQRLAAQFRAEPELFKAVYLPSQPEFFSRHGLLYLELDELWKLSDRLTEAAPFLGSLAQDRSLNGLFTTLGRALGEPLSADYQARIKAMLDSVRDAIEAELQGSAYRRSWQDLLGGDELRQENPRSFVLVQPALDEDSVRRAGAALDRAHSFARSAEAMAAKGGGALDIRLTGPAAIDDEELESVNQGAGIATAASFALVCVILFLGMRSTRLVLATLATLFLGLITTAAFAAFVFGSLNLLSVTFAVLFIGLGVDFGIQFGMRYREEVNAGMAAEAEKKAALNRTARGIAGALALAAVAAAISFFSFVPTSYRALAELGMISGAGMFIALAANLIVLPALLVVIPMPADFGQTAIVHAGGLQFAIGRHRRKILWGAALLAAGAALLLPHARFDFNPINLKDETTESVATFRDLLADPDTTPYSIDIVTDNLAQAQQLAARLSELPEVDKALTLASFVPKKQNDKLAIIADLSLVLQPLVTARNLSTPPAGDAEREALERFRLKLMEAADSGKDKGAGKSTDDGAASDTGQGAYARSSGGANEGNEDSGIYADSARLLAEAIARFQQRGASPENLDNLRQRLLGDLTRTLDRLRDLLTPPPVTLENLPQGLKQRYVNPDGLARVEVFPKQNLGDNQALRRFVAAVQAVAPNAIGAPVSLVEGGGAVVTASVQAAIYGLCGIIVLLLVVLRSAGDTLSVLVPLALSALLTIACSVLFDIPFNFANLIALPLLLGIGIAFGIYLVMRQRSGMNIDDLFHSSTPRAVFFSAATTIASFGALAFSSHRGMSSMGVLLTLALSFALVSTLLVLPALMAARERSGRG
ncbi:MAG: MMPL family transporter [Burkholderiales bacterium]|nr:MMPL family transporter [Burkholderiales bacterium]